MLVGRGLAMEAGGRRGMAGTQAVSAPPQISSEESASVNSPGGKRISNMKMRTGLISGLLDARLHPIDSEHSCSLDKFILDIEGISQALSALGHQIFDSSC